MSIFTKYLTRWEELYINLTGLALSEVSEVESADLTVMREEFYSLATPVVQYGLSECELSALMLVALSGLHNVIAANISILQEQRGKNTKYPDYGLISILNEIILKPTENRPGLLIKDDSVLNSYFVMNAKGESVDVTLDMPLILRPGVQAWMLGEEFSLGDASTVVALYMPEEMDEIVAHKDQVLELCSVFSNMNATSERGIIFLKGAKGSGKCFITKAMAAVVSMPLLIVDIKKLLSYESVLMDMMIRRTVQKSFFDGGIIYLDFGDEENFDKSALQRVVASLQRFWSILIIGASGNQLEELSITGFLHILDIEPATKLEQKAYWEYFIKHLFIKFNDEVSLDEIVSTYDMNPGRIKRALCCARGLSEFDGANFCIDESLIKTEIRKICAGHFTELATKLSTPFGWDDLKASEKTKSLMREAVNRIRYKSVVNEEYGFAKRLPYGQGLSVAFYGPPGTGKTMAATVMARELGLDIYRIDLSQISSKYIGESEKNLSAVFEAAKYSNSILFFDEADALFARRTDVSTSNDKHANSETAYLLQKMEEYSGISILATNVIQNFDAAFKRRITYMIPVEKPTEEERLILWKSVFPEGTPLDRDVNFEGYAKASELSGAEIKSAAIRAAYMAASQNRPVNHMDIAVAIDEEYKKTGHISILPQLMGTGGW